MKTYFFEKFISGQRGKFLNLRSAVQDISAHFCLDDEFTALEDVIDYAFTLEDLGVLAYRGGVWFVVLTDKINIHRV